MFGERKMCPAKTRVSRCVKKVKKKSPDVNPYAVCQASTGQSYATGKSVTKEGKPIKKKKKKKGKGKMESINTLRKFINDLKKPENEAFIEGVIMKGFDVCFENCGKKHTKECIEEEAENMPKVLATPETSKGAEEMQDDMRKLEDELEDVEETREDIQKKSIIRQQEAEKVA
jgi:hypothetical protein